MLQLWALLKKDLCIESRMRETLVLLLSLAFLLSVVVGFGVQRVMLDLANQKELFPSLLWLVFLISAAVSIGRSYEYEQQQSALLGVLLTGVAPVKIFIAKMISNFILLSLSFAITALVLAVLLDVSFIIGWQQILLVVILVLFGLSNLATLLAAMTRDCGLKGLLLPLLLIPLFFPLLFCGIELLSLALLVQLPVYQTSWFLLLLVLNLAYFMLGLSLFEYLVKDF